MIWAALRSFIQVNALRILQLGAAAATVILVLLNARSSGRTAQKVEQYEQAIKARKRMEAVPPATDSGTVERLQRGDF